MARDALFYTQSVSTATGKRVVEICSPAGDSVPVVEDPAEFSDPSVDLHIACFVDDRLAGYITRQSGQVEYQTVDSLSVAYVALEDPDCLPCRRNRSLADGKPPLLFEDPKLARPTRVPHAAIWTAAALSLIPAFILVKWPEYNNALTAYLLNVLLMVIPIAMTALGASNRADSVRDKALREGVASEQSKWLPKAESACNRLLAIRADAQILRDSLACGCSQIDKYLADLPAERRALVHSLFSSQCERSLATVSSVVNHTNGAINDWERFIQQSCASGECEQIFSNIRRMTESLNSVVADAKRRSNTTSPVDCTAGLRNRIAESKPLYADGAPASPSDSV